MGSVSAWFARLCDKRASDAELRRWKRQAGELEKRIAELERTNSYERAVRQASDGDYSVQVRDLETTITKLRSELSVRELEVKELTALVGSLHAKIEQCTAVAVRATEEAKHGPRRARQ